VKRFVVHVSPATSLPLRAQLTQEKLLRQYFRGQPLKFSLIRPGLWGLTARHDPILNCLQIAETASEEQQEAFDHTYYQGLALMIGRLRGYEVFAPKTISIPQRGISAPVNQRGIAPSYAARHCSSGRSTSSVSFQRMRRRSPPVSPIA
jgi:hypothetical protein